MEDVKICNVCQKRIDLNTKYVLLGTYEKKGKKILEEAFFHFLCFTQWYNAKVEEKAKNKIQLAQKKAIGLLGNILGKSQTDKLKTFDIN